MAIDKTLLLNMLINSAPLLMQALSKPYNSPGSWVDGENPLDDMFGHAKDLKYLQDRGYDMGLVQDYMLNTADNFTNYTDAAVNAISQISSDADDASSLVKGFSRSFPSDFKQNPLNPTQIYDMVADGYDTPALKSAFAMLHGSQLPKRKPIIPNLIDDLPF